MNMKLEEPYGDFEGYQGGFALEKVQETLLQKGMQKNSHYHGYGSRSPHREPRSPLIDPTHGKSQASLTELPKHEEDKKQNEWKWWVWY